MNSLTSPTIAIRQHPDEKPHPNNEASPALEHYRAGEEVCREGEPGDKFFLIRNGTAEVRRQTPEGPRVLARLGRKDLFGDQAVVRQTTRNATIIAVDDLYVYTIDEKWFAPHRSVIQRFVQRTVDVYGVPQ
jgi:signal-transduction protein with cAMP-binding, CBS, and nucleotidyltransferase domain